MITKLFEIRDIATFIPVLATRIEHENEAQSYLLLRAEFRNPLKPLARCILLCRINSHGGECQILPHNWRGRTMVTAHDHIIKNWNQLEDGDVIDVEFILGETRVRKISERVDHD